MGGGARVIEYAKRECGVNCVGERRLTARERERMRGDKETVRWQETRRKNGGERAPD